MLALGGNAMTNADGRARPEDQIAAAEVAMEAVAQLLAHDVEVVITHGNGPQVGNLLVKNELAASVVPPVPAGLVRRADAGDARVRPDGRPRRGPGPARGSSGGARPW